jgi:hypothetical protein
VTPPQLATAQRPAGSQNPAARLPGSAPPLPRQRRRGLLLLGVALTCAAGVATAALVTSAGHRVPVVVATRDIPLGAVITAADLSTAEVSTGAGVSSIPGRQESQVTGQIAATDVPAGTLVVPGDLTSAAGPAAGQALVPVALKSWQIPASGLAGGTPVQAVPTPGAAGQAGSGGPAGQALGHPVTATVYRVSGADAAGNIVVDLLVPAAEGSAVARQASTGQIAIIETGRRS